MRHEPVRRSGARLLFEAALFAAAGIGAVICARTIGEVWRHEAAILVIERDMARIQQLLREAGVARPARPDEKR